MVTPSMTVVYMYGVTPFGRATVGAGCPTGPCWTSGIVIGVAVVAVVGFAAAGAVGVVIVALQQSWSKLGVEEMSRHEHDASCRCISNGVCADDLDHSQACSIRKFVKWK